MTFIGKKSRREVELLRTCIDMIEIGLFNPFLK